MVQVRHAACAHVLGAAQGGGRAWKEGCFADAPGWVQALMANNFRTPLGAFMIAGLSGLPLWLWLHMRCVRA